MELINNINKTLKDDIKQELKAGSKLAIAASCFSIYAFKELKEQLKNIDQLRFIFTSPTFTAEKVDKQQREFYIPKLNRERSLYGTEFEIKLRNELTQRAIAKECADWIRKKVCFKSNRTDQLMQGFINVDETTYMPITGFTTVDLGCEKGNNAYTMISKLKAEESTEFIKLFDEIWNDQSKLQVVTDQVLDSISNAYKENAPDFLYFVALYNIFNEFLEDISEDILPNEATGFKNSVIWNKLYNFQKDACMGIINKLEKFNGCILADSVGLGKTYTALSVIKYYENRNKSVLVLCPKKLNDNWITYKSNYINNPLEKDRLRYDILFHSDLSRNGGKSNGVDLNYVNWSNYDLVVIDESHNFRNGGKITTDENDENPRENRYLQLLNKVIRKGVKTKVLMLSATPVNNRFNDLKHQIALAYEGNTENIDHLLNTENGIDDIFRQAQTEYNKWAKLPSSQRTTQALLQRLSFDFFEILDSVTIARSRKHIEQYYDTADIGKFPTRLTPISRYPALTDLADASNFNIIFEHLQKLNLAVYTPSHFLLPSRVEKYNLFKDKEGYGGLSLQGREIGIRKLMSVNLLKRLESSVNSFRLTLTRMQEYLKSITEKVENYSPNAVVDEIDLESVLSDEETEDILIGGKKTQIALADMDYTQWLHFLKKDYDLITLLLSHIKPITPEHDSKLQQLIEELRNKFRNPINGDNKKVIIFTAFSDTAIYLYENLADLIYQKTGLHTALVTGNVEARSTLKLKEKLDFNKVLTLFSPISKERNTVFPGLKKEIDVLIASDCISEGQNLQDCDYLINYDIHWNPVRIIQRFGRIDRIGSQNEVIQLVNYWPDMSLDEYINLKRRVEARMKISVLTATGDDNPLTTEEKEDLEYRHAQLKRLQEEVIDLEEMNSGVSIMDLGLNEFRLDLLEYIKTNPAVEKSPHGLHAVVPANNQAQRGVIYVLKNRNNAINIDKKNRLHPFYMVYVGMDGEVIINHLSPKDLLDRMRLLCRGKVEPYLELCRAFNAETRDGRNMKTYSSLLHKAVASVMTVKEESDLDSFLSGVQGSLFTEEIHGLDDFELICFLVIK